MMKALVTGGAGFIGSHLVDGLLARGADVRVLDNLSTGHRANLAGVLGDVELVEGDIRSPAAVRRAVDGCDVVLHHAALPSVPRSVADPAGSHAVNATGTLNVLMAARDEGVRRVVYASSSSVYGADPTLPKHESARPLPLSPYAVAKLAGETYCASFLGVYGLEAVALRYFNVFGPRQDPASEYAAVIPKFMAALSAGRPPTIFGDGEQSRDFTYVDNIVEANLAALDAPGAAGEVMNVACGQRTTLNELAHGLIDRFDLDVEPAYGPARPGEVRHSLADVEKASRLLGYEPRIDFAEGLGRTVARHLHSAVLRAA
jgi:UDP-glucose 4-epimerase